MWELDYKESRAPKNWCFWTVVLEKTLESPLDCKEIQSVHPKGNQSWVFTETTDAEAETPILWPPHAKSWLIWKDPGAGKDWRQEKGTREHEMAGWHHNSMDMNLSKFQKLVMDREAWRAACSPWGRKESDTTEWLNWTKLKGWKDTNADNSVTIEWASLVAQTVKNLSAMWEDLGSILGWGRSLRGGHGNPLLYSCLENPHGQNSLVGYSPRGCKKSDTTEQLSTQHTEC